MNHPGTELHDLAARIDAIDDGEELEAIYYDHVRQRDEDELLPVLVRAVERCGPGKDHGYCLDYQWHIERRFLRNQYVPLLEASFRRKPSFLSYEFLDHFADPRAAVDEALAREMPDGLRDKLLEYLAEPPAIVDDSTTTSVDRSEWQLADGVLALDQELRRDDLEHVARHLPDTRVIRSRVIHEEAFEVLSRLPSLASLEHLGRGFTDEQWCREDLYALDRGATAGLVTRIHLAHICNKDLKIVGKLTNLRQLQVRASGIRDDGLSPLADLPKLEVLDLGRNLEEEFLGRGLVHVRTEPLRELVLDKIGNTYAGRNADAAPIPVETAEAIARFDKLRRLELSNNRFAAKAFAPLGTLANLERLDCNDVGLGNAHAGFLSGLSALQELRLWDNPGLGDAAVQHIARCSRLQTLWLARTRVTNDGLGRLADLGELEVLDIRKTRVTAEGLAALSRLPLKRLELGSKRLTEDAIEPLSTMHGLRTLVLTKDTPISAAGVERLQRALPDCEVTKRTW